MHLPMNRDHPITSMSITFSRNVIKRSNYVISSKNIHFVGVFNHYSLIFYFDEDNHANGYNLYEKTKRNTLAKI